MLGNSLAARETAKTVAKNYELKLYTFPFLSSKWLKEDTIFGDDEQLWEVSPFEWISWINNAEVVITDSFHMTVFSIMLHKNFYVVEKDGKEKSQNNRIYNLLKLVGLEDRFLMSNISPEDISLSETNINWDEIDKVLDEQREKSLTFVDNIMGNIFSVAEEKSL